MINKKQIALLVLFFILLVVFLVVWHEYKMRQMIVYQPEKNSSQLNENIVNHQTENLKENKEATISTQGLASDDAKLVKETNVDLSDIDKELNSLDQELSKLSF